MELEAPKEGLVEVPVGSLEPGMYIAQVDRPWLETPFAVQGFFVQCRDEIDFVAQHCAYVFVDPRRRSEAAAESSRRSPRRSYKDKTSLKNELARAEVDLTNATDAMSKVFKRLSAGGHLDVAVVRSAINPVIESVLRNNEAMAALVRMKKKGEYLFNHSLAVAVWATILGRHLGLDRSRLENLALGGALLDVGMASMESDPSRSARSLNAREMDEMRKHVPLGVDLLKLNEASLSQDILGMVAAHHERHDGSGYPRGLKGNDIPLFGRIAGLVDSYDAMITTRPYAKPRSSFEAMQELADLKDKLFQGNLVEQFMQAVGLFPTGAVVMLNTGEVGVVIKQNITRRLRPKVVVVLDQDGKRKDSLVVIDLAKYSDGEDRSDCWISQELEPGAHGIHPDEYFL